MDASFGRGVIAALLLQAPAVLAAAPAVYPTPEAAATAVAEAVEARERDALLAVFGPENEALVFSGDRARDRADWARFAAAYAEMRRVAVEEDGSARLYVGRDQWPFPAPLAQGAAGWSFDAQAAREEVRARRIGRNELDVIDLLRAYVDVQRTYREQDWDGDGVMVFAAHVLSAPGRRDGLWWPAAEGAPESPIGDFMARASAEGYVAVDASGAAEAPEPYLGYYYRILTRQGEHAPGGAMDYILNGAMVGGHALLAFPAAWGETGVMSFMVAENGVVLEADLGEDTLEAAAAIDAYDPDAAWSPVQ